MNNISQTLAELIAGYFADATDNGRSCRLLVPGLSKTVAIELNDLLRNKGVVSLLVIGPNDLPDKHRGWIRPEGVTGQREGSLVIVVCPGEITRLQDSVRGAGGTIRSMSFSDEWPWVDDGNESFRFDGPFLERLLNHWSADLKIRGWLKEFILQGLLRGTQNCPARADILFIHILGTFSPTMFPSETDIRYKFLRFCGIPRPDTIEDIGNAQDYVGKCQKLCDGIRSVCDHQGVRVEVLERSNETDADATLKARTARALDTFLDGMGIDPDGLQGVLALRHCWGEPNDTEVWQSLTYRRLKDLFEIAEKDDTSLECEVKCERGFLSVSGSTLNTHFGKEFSIRAKYQAKNWVDHEVALCHRGKDLQIHKCTAEAGEFVFNVKTGEYFHKHGKPIPLKIALRKGTTTMKDWRLRLNLVGKERPVIITTTTDSASLTHDGPRATDEREVDLGSVPVNGPTAITILHTGDKPPTTLRYNDEDIPLVAVGDGVVQGHLPANPSQTSSGQVKVEVGFDNHSVYMTLEAKDCADGQFTLEDELRSSLVRSKKERLSKLLKILDGTETDSSLALGQLDESTRRRSQLGYLFELGADSHLPVVSDLSVGTIMATPREVKGKYRYVGAYTNPPLGTFLLSDRALELANEYRDKRKALLELLRSRLGIGNKKLDRPLYAAVPVYVNAHEAELQDTIVEYLNTYAVILAELETGTGQFNWHDLFFLLHLDSVVEAKGENREGSFFLLGPWHPLVVAKRFMVQYALWRTSHRVVDSKQGLPISRLAAVFKRVNAFRWQPTLRSDTDEIGLAYCAATSDPGWILAVHVQSGRLHMNVVESALNRIKGVLGLDSNWLPQSTEDLTVSYVKDFVRAYPVSRSLAMRVRHGYSIDRIVTATREVMYAETEATQFGKQLPGGIHIFSDNPTEGNGTYEWQAPPVCLYECRDQDQIDFTDLDLYPPFREITFVNQTSNLDVPRGLGIESVFSQPLMRMTSGIKGSPSSVLIETIGVTSNGHPPTEIGSAFINCLSKALALASVRLSANLSLDLPNRLECRWTVFPGQQVDPAVFVKYIQDGHVDGTQERALWDYRASIEESISSYFILSTIPRSFRQSLSGSPVLGRRNVASEFIKELGEVGISIGSEALRSGKKAKGVIGVVGAIRMLTQPGVVGAVLQNDDTHVGLLIPVDSFASILSQEEKGKRADLLAINITLPKDDQSVRFAIAAIECKYLSHKFTSDLDVSEALNQAVETWRAVSALFDGAGTAEGVLERLTLAHLVGFGLRLRASNSTDWMEKERRILASLLTSRFVMDKPMANAVLISTECELEKAELRKRSGWWLRLAPGHWPGISDSPELQLAREELSRLFRTADHSDELKDKGYGKEVPNAGNESNSSIERASDQSATPSPFASQVEVEVPRAQQSEAVDAQSDRHQFFETLRPLLIGVDAQGKSVTYDPQNANRPLDNLNIMVTGSSGKGKTALLKTIIWKLRSQGKHVLMLDFKNDFAPDESFIRRSALHSQYVLFDGLPYNPLIPTPSRNPRTGEVVVHLSRHITGLAAVLRETYQLGPLQEFELKDAIRKAFDDFGIQSEGMSPYDAHQEYPDFNNVGTRLGEMSSTTRRRLDPLFDLDLFRDSFRRNTFASMLADSYVIQLSDIDSDYVKSALSRMIVLSSYNYYSLGEHSPEIRQYLVFDEAHRIAESSYLRSLVLQCRAYGIGVILSSQYPRHFPPDISGSMQTKIIHGNDRDEAQVKDIVSMIGWQGSDEPLRRLGMFEAIVSNPHYQNIQVATIAYPQALVLDYLAKHKHVTLGEIAALDGLYSSKAKYVLDTMIKQGLIEEVSGSYSLIVTSG